MIKRIEFISRFVPDNPSSNPYSSLDAYMGKEVDAADEFNEWQKLGAGKFRIVSILESRNDPGGNIKIVVYYEELDNNQIAQIWHLQS